MTYFVKILCSVLVLFFIGNVYAVNKKFEKWQIPSYFRGFNVLPPKAGQDFIDLKNLDGNLVQINMRGFMEPDKPYSVIQPNTDSTDRFVKYCDETGLYFIIAVRSGPGAYDVYQEMSGKTGASRIWDEDNSAERKLYAEMLKKIITRYSEDTLFIGINIIVEPRPRVKSIPANTSGIYKRFLENIFDIHMDEVYEYFVKEIRKVNNEIPIIVENFAFSTPELFPAYILEDPYIVYDAHMYVPYEFTHADIPNSQVYPGNYKNITKVSSEYHDRNFIKNTVFHKLRSFQLKTKAPVFIGEFGLKHPQPGGDIYLKDVLDICAEYGWHFALWEWRSSIDYEWNIEKFEDVKYWEVIMNHFH